MNITAISMAAVAFCIISVVLKQSRPEFSVAFSFCTVAVVLILVFNEIKPLFELFNTVSLLSGVSDEGLKIVLKAVGICFISQFASDTCRGAGETAMAGVVETAGKVTVMLAAIPLFNELLKGALGFIEK